ncbi:hypothetical protein [Streptomyces sp. NBC_00986]|uniref:hypothetical protein n=1 Tax=Streptomyces sp. NBC_00986 TaxID=2903702 RepID=UPI0038698543|nr:hypothetical protein OG504_19400 [Streptomyces sp. NBC_00986]
MTQPGNTVGAHATARETRHGVAQLEVTAGVYDHPVGLGPRDRMPQLDTNVRRSKPS